MALNEGGISAWLDVEGTDAIWKIQIMAISFSEQQASLGPSGEEALARRRS